MKTTEKWVISNECVPAPAKILQMFTKTKLAKEKVMGEVTNFAQTSFKT